MLKACWDCLVGYDLMREGRHTEEPYDTQLIGISSRAPPWPQTQKNNEKMFILPKKLTADDRIVLGGEMRNDPDNLTIGLLTGYESPDYENIACQLEVNYSPYDKMAIKIIQNGNQEIISDFNTSDYLDRGEYTFEISFLVRNGAITVFVGSSSIKTITLKHNAEDIRFLSVSGDIIRVSQLNFQFGS